MMVVSWIVVLLLTAIAAFTDAITGRIPNKLTLTAAVIALAMAAANGVDVLALSFIGGLACAAAPLLLYRCSKTAIGGGDIKLFAVLGLLLGPASGLEIQLVAYILCSVFVLLQLAFKRKLGRMLKNAIRVAASHLSKQKDRLLPGEDLLTPVRIGPAIFASSVLELCWNWGLL
jgi:Flp pilus assembly protein protease CpaA